jgi:disulfide bond formation protein DsbB
MIQLKKNTVLCVILIFSIFALIAAYFIQHVLGHQPCNLCLIERVPYILTIIIIIINFIFKKFEKFFLINLVLIFISAALISSYHVGIEQGFISESLVCDLKDQITSLSKENILIELKNKTISCKNVTFKIIGLSLATINTFISLILSFITIRLFLNYEKNR